MSIKVENEVEVYEKNGEEAPAMKRENILIKSHGIWHDRIVLRVGRNEYTVITDDLLAAIKNASNSNKF